ncbi:hypothetical protein TanjilG_20367 [Lupinus angustifolius]|uniref:Reverse transcriptase zinc-binding domain-containing protein n=1 Tax=Lupinus angustifolius TaxID=3871 RepID=A0A4P1RVU7_LUPAN|nr:hypothetical protein TanjilG_20367 [Lupinus angustifolius]
MGRVKLVNSIIHNILIYSFHVYARSSQLLKHIDNYIRNFIWYGDINVRKMVIVAWQKVCKPKKEGGLGVRSIKLLNKVAMLKLAWEMLTLNLDWVVSGIKRSLNNNTISTRYFKSSIWVGVKFSMEEAMSNSIWMVGNGNSINFWTDNWIGYLIVTDMGLPRNIQLSLSALVADFMHFFIRVIPSYFS